MRLLLDTHVFIWLESNPSELPPNVQPLLQDTENQLYLSYVSIREIRVKLGIGKLKTAWPLEARVALARSNLGLNLLPITLPHIYKLDQLPLHHRDPFDRLLIAQALTEQMGLVTGDRILHTYPILTVW